MTFNDVMDQEDQDRAFVDDVLIRLTGCPGQLSVAVRIAFLTIGKGFRLVIDHTKARGARLAMDPNYTRFDKSEPIDVPAAIAREMIESGLMKKLDYPGADWWCMIQ